jgi:PIN domain
VSVVLYDACVLWSAPLRDLLIRLGIAGLVQAKWTDQILDEVFRTVQGKRPHLSADALLRTRMMMIRAVRDCLIVDYQGHIPSLNLPDPEDRHVLAAAIQGGVQVIVTFNLKDFPPAQLASYQIEAMHPDVLLLELLEQAEGRVLRILQEQASALKNPPVALEDLVGTLQACGLPRSMARVESLLGGI